MKNRLQEFMTREGLTAARLAEIVGVQPSAISHILSGRNFPRFDFLHNLLKAYPNMNARWLMLGEEDIYIKQGSLRKISESTAQNTALPERQHRLFTDDNDSGFEQHPADNDIRKSISIKHKAVDKIIMFYEDGTFSIYENR